MNLSCFVGGSTRRSSRTGLIALTMVAITTGLLVGTATAQTPTTPVVVATSSVQGATLGIPRWKGYMSPTDPDKFWLCFANDGGSSNNLRYTTDAGATWSTNTITINGYMDFHLSLFGSGNDLYFSFPASVQNAIGFRRFHDPAQSASDANALVNLSGTTASYRSNTMVQNNGRIWVFTRLGGSASENVEYQYSDNGGTSWTSGVAFSTGATDIRIGSMPYVNGNPALVVLYLNDSRGYEYYLWNGSSFVANSDHSIYAINPGYDRCFSHNQINDTTMHLVFGQGTNLRHVWKNYANGTGSWNTNIIATEANNGSIEWYPITTVRGNEMYVFYCRKSSSDEATSRIYYKCWSQTTQTWGSEYQVSTQTYSRDPNTCFHVPVSADYIPVFYSGGSGTYSVYFSKIAVTAGVADTIPPDSIDDLGAAPASNGRVTLTWTASGDDHSNGSASSYDLRYALDPLQESNWSDAVRIGNTPDPAAAGEGESFTISDIPGGVVYFALKSIDDGANESAISNLALILVSDVDNPDHDILLPDHTGLIALYPNPFNSEARIDFSVATASLLTLRVYNVLGQEVRSLVNEPKSSGSYHVWWDGTDDRGSPVASGMYFCRLVAENVSDTRKLVYLK
jgi:hypothetical protein